MRVSIPICICMCVQTPLKVLSLKWHLLQKLTLNIPEKCIKTADPKVHL